MAIDGLVPMFLAPQHPELGRQPDRYDLQPLGRGMAAAQREIKSAGRDTPGTR
jgi:hypothetical protein